MDVYSVIAEPSGSPMYLVGSYSSQAKAKEVIMDKFGTICKKIDPLGGSCFACICQFRSMSTIISICLTELED